MLPGKGVSLTVGGVDEVHHAAVLVFRGDGPGARGALGRRQVGRGRHNGHQQSGARAKNQGRPWFPPLLFTIQYLGWMIPLLVRLVLLDINTVL